MAQKIELQNEKLKMLCDEYRSHNGFNPQDYLTYGVKRGLRNPDGTGVMAGLTKVCSVEGYYIDDGEKTAKAIFS